MKPIVGQTWVHRTKRKTVDVIDTDYGTYRIEAVRLVHASGRRSWKTLSAFLREYVPNDGFRGGYKPSSGTSCSASSEVTNE